jgi:hypothetical protein
MEIGGGIFRIENPSVKPNFSYKKYGQFMCETFAKKNCLLLS